MSKKAKIRELFEQAGFNYHIEFMKALQDVDPQTKIEALVSVAPYFMERLKESSETDDSIDVTPKPKQLSKASDLELLKLMDGKPNKKTNRK